MLLSKQNHSSKVETCLLYRKHLEQTFYFALTLSQDNYIIIFRLPYDFERKIIQSMKKNTENQKKEKVSSVIRAFQIFSMIIFAFLLAFLLLNICTTRKKLHILISDYVTSVAINEDYYDNYIEYGFTKEQCEEFIKSDTITDLVTEVLNDRIVSLFHNTTRFTYSEDDCNNIIKSKLSELNEKYNIGLTDTVLDSLTKYTLDITGLTNMRI